jgi:hypothetical protein
MQADNALVQSIDQQQGVIGAIFEQVVSDASTLLARYCAQTAEVLKRG